MGFLQLLTYYLLASLPIINQDVNQSSVNTVHETSNNLVNSNFQCPVIDQSNNFDGLPFNATQDICYAQNDKTDELNKSELDIQSTIKFLNKTKDNNFIYNAELQQTKQLTKKFYSKAVKNLPIVCVDTFVVNIDTNEYFLIKRKTNPAKGVFWLPGGRLYKGESFFECSIRKCFEEMGFMVNPSMLIDVYSTTFINSAWNTPTHTINIAVLAFVNGENVPQLNEFHTDYQWVPVNSYSDNEYVETIRRKAIEILEHS